MHNDNKQLDPSSFAASQVIESSLEQAEQAIGAQALAEDFFQRFFAQYPETRDYFSQTNISSFGPKKFRYISEFIVDIYRHPNYAEGNLSEEVLRHQMYGLVDKEYYFALLDALHLSVKQALDQRWSQEQEEAWSDANAALRHTINTAVTELF